MDSPSIPPRLARLPSCRGLPVPWFVHRRGDGEDFDFRVVDPARFSAALRRRLCWTCGGPLGARAAFIGGPLSAAQRLFSDPPSHRECAEYALRTCPFLSNPSACRRGDDLQTPAAVLQAIAAGNPEVSAMVIARGRMEQPSPFVVRPTAVDEVLWFRSGRPAARDEVLAAIQKASAQPEVLSSPGRSRILADLGRLRAALP